MPQWICSQIGAREHYAVPRALRHAGQLDTLHTDFWADAVVRAVKFGKMRSLAGRFHLDLAGAKIVSWNLRSLAWEAGLRWRTWERGVPGAYLGYIAVGQNFACAVRDELRRRSLANGTVFFTYDTGALETLEWLRERGVPCVLDQIDPSRVEAELVCEEEKRWADWATSTTEVPEGFFLRREREWAMADRIVVNSEFSRCGLIQQGVPAEKLVVVPLCYEAGAMEIVVAAPEPSRARPLKVLFLGQVILRKGIQYLIEAAKLLRDEPISFEVVGPIGISEQAVKSAPANITFHGQASRDQIGVWYRQCDVFVLPTLSDGFGITQIEAMAHALPVIATPNCGDVVTDGTDGFLVPPCQAKSLAATIRRYLSEPGLLLAHRVAALEKSRQFKLNALAQRLLSLGESLLRR
jgi:glycosyltransferase involved in cell wall biosynthesis